MDQRYKQLGINTILVFIGKVGSALIGFLMLPLYTKWLSPEEFGAAELVNTYSNICLSIFTFCLADAIFIYPKTANKRDKKSYFTSGLFTIFAFYLLYLAIVGVLQSVFCNYDWFIIENAHLIYLLSFSLFLQSYFQQFTRSIDRMKIYSISGVVQTFSIACFSYIFIHKYHSTGYIYSLISANFVSCLFIFVSVKLYNYISLTSFNRKMLKELLLYGIPLIPNSMMWWLVDGINKPIMEANLGLSAIGIYTVASKFPSVLNVITGALGNACGISIIEEYGKSDFNFFFNKIFKLIFFCLISICFCLAILSNYIIEIFSDVTYHEAANLLPILLLSVLLSNSAGLVGGVFSARKQSKYYFYSSFWGALTSLTLTFLLISYFGLYGVVWSLVCSFGVMFVSRLLYAWRDINQFDINYYTLSILSYIVFMLSYYYLTGIYKITLCIVVFFLFLLLNKTILYLIVNILISKIKKYKL